MRKQVEIHEKKDPAPYPARPPLTLLANRGNSFLRTATSKIVFVTGFAKTRHVATVYKNGYGRF